MPRKLRFGGREVKPDTRYLYDMEEVVYDKKWLENAENVPLYFMYRGLYKPGDRETIVENNLRYDITVIPARMLGEEYVKTKGHYHPKANEMTYPELYGVLEGRAHYLLQKRTDGGVSRTVLVEAEEGDMVIIPPGYGHITINPSKEDLKMANWVCRDFDSIYEPILERKGGAWFELEDEFVKNENYEDVPELERFKASKNDPFDGDIYDLIETSEKLKFLTDPGDSIDLFRNLEFFKL
ncbi:MAG: glucose-6-phosphate isomerase family protein [Candidatus Aenigmatarchaeota archaeon]